MTLVKNAPKSIQIITEIRYVILRTSSSEATTHQPEPVKFIDKPTSKDPKPAVSLPTFPPKHMKNNWVGPPNPKSNLRLVSYYQAENESRIEKYYREKRIEVQEWNQEFWENHNKNFYKMKEEFVQKRKQELFGTDSATSKNTVLPPDELSKFYKQFLDENYATHMQYNKEWYKRNIGLLLPAILVYFYQLARQFKLVKR